MKVKLYSSKKDSIFIQTLTWFHDPILAPLAVGLKVFIFGSYDQQWGIFAAAALIGALVYQPEIF